MLAYYGYKQLGEHHLAWPSTLGGAPQLLAFPKLRSASSAWCWALPSRISSSRASRMPRPPRAFHPGISSPVTKTYFGEGATVELILARVY